MSTIPPIGTRRTAPPTANTETPSVILSEEPSNRISETMPSRYVAHNDPADAPYQYPMADEEIVKVDIHGHPRGKYNYDVSHAGPTSSGDEVKSPHKEVTLHKKNLL